MCFGYEKAFVFCARLAIYWAVHFHPEDEELGGKGLPEIFKINESDSLKAVFGGVVRINQTGTFCPGPIVPIVIWLDELLSKK